MGFFRRVRERLAAFVPRRRRERDDHQRRGELEHFRDEFWSELERMFSLRFSPLREGWWPAIDLQSNGREYTLTADVPGLSEKELDVCLTRDSVVLRGEQSTEHEERGRRFYRIERGYRSFHRVVPLPVDADPDRARAKYRHGVLKVRIPRSRSKARRIPVAA